MFLDSMDWLCGSIVSGQVFIQGVLLHANADFSEKVVKHRNHAGRVGISPGMKKNALSAPKRKTE
jgi:hypothetical protein